MPKCLFRTNFVSLSFHVDTIRKDQRRFMCNTKKKMNNNNNNNTTYVL